MDCGYVSDSDNDSDMTWLDMTCGDGGATMRYKHSKEEREPPGGQARSLRKTDGGSNSRNSNNNVRDALTMRDPQTSSVTFSDRGDCDS